MCDDCGKTEFYDTARPQRLATDEGCWVYVPNLGSDQRPAAPQDPPFHSSSPGFEQSDSESRTTDPVVDPESGAVLPRRRRRRRGRNDSQPEAGRMFCAWMVQNRIGSLTFWHSWLHSRTIPLEVKILGVLERVRKKELHLHHHNGETQLIFGLLHDGNGRLRSGPCRWWKHSCRHPMRHSCCLRRCLVKRNWKQNIWIWTKWIQPMESSIYLVDTLREPLQQKLLFQKRKLLSDYEHISRYPNESVRQFANRYARVEKDLFAIGISTAAIYDSESRGNRLLDRSHWTPDLQRLVPIGAGNSLVFDPASEPLNFQRPDFKPSPPVAGSGNTNGIRDQVPLLRLHLGHLLRALRQWHLHLPPIDLPQKGITSETCYQADQSSWGGEADSWRTCRTRSTSLCARVPRYWRVCWTWRTWWRAQSTTRCWPRRWRRCLSSSRASQCADRDLEEVAVDGAC